MLDPKNITAVIVTRGDVDMSPILESLKPFQETIVWDNSKQPNRIIYGRFLGAYMAKTKYVYTQDDDCVVQWEGLLRDHEEGSVTCNMPQDRRSGYPDGINLIGWGCIFERQHLSGLEYYLKVYPYDEFFLRLADRIFTKLNRCKRTEVPFTNLPHATADYRMAGNHFGGAEGKSNNHSHHEDLKEVRRRFAGIEYAVGA